MDFIQSKPDSMKYKGLIYEMGKGSIQIPKFQRDFVWSIDKTARLLDSILKGYPIGTFIFWETAKQMKGIKNIGDVELPQASEGSEVLYILDGQQRIASLYAVRMGSNIQKTNEKKRTNYCNILVNLDKDVSESDGQIVTPKDKAVGKSIPLHKILNFTYSMAEELSSDYSKEQLDTIERYRNAFNDYEFSTITLKQRDIDSVAEVFTRINTSGQTLKLFEIMSAKTYDEERDFYMQDKWDELIKRLGKCGYQGISNSVILHLLSLVLSPSKECKRKTILELDKKEIIDNWNLVVSALEDSIDYCKTTYGITVSRILPYDSMLIPFAYFFYYSKSQPNPNQKKSLEEYFWSASLSFRYSSGAETKLARDIKSIDKILNNKHPKYKDIKDNIRLDSPQSLINTSFSTSSSYCKAILCLLAFKGPRDFDGNLVTLDNSYLKVASSKNYHHFFPKAFLKKRNIPNENSLMNITFVSDHLNKKEVRAKCPSNYISKFKDGNDKIEEALNSHFIKLDGFGIENDDYGAFLNARAKWIYEELQSKLPDLEKPID